MGKVMESQFKGHHPLPPQPPPSDPLSFGVTEPRAPWFIFNLLILQLTERRRLFLDGLVQGFKAASSLDPFTSLRRRGVAAQLGEIYTYFSIMENSLLDIELLT